MRVRRDAYVLGEAWRAASPEQRLALRTRAVLSTRPGDVASHQSSLAQHRLPLYGVPLTTVDVLADVKRTRTANGLRSHPRGSLPFVVDDGYRCVPAAVAVAQVLVRSGLVAAMVPLDAALHTGRCGLDDVSAALEPLCATPRLRRRGEALIGRADPRCESPGETRTRLLLHDLGFDVRSQVEVHDEGWLVGRVDFLVGEHVVVEFDGAVKYGGADGREALVAEKRREDALRRLGYVVIRLTWADLARPEWVAAQIRRAMTRTLSQGGETPAS